VRIEFQRKIDRLFGQWICRFLSVIYRKDRATTLDHAPKRILIILLSEMGSLVLAHPMFLYLKERCPGVSLHVLLFEKNRECLEVLDTVPSENILTINDKTFSLFARSCVTSLFKIRRQKYDAVIDCELFARISSIFSGLSGAPIRVGFHPHTQEGLYRGDFINRPVLYNPYHHITQQFLTLAEAIDSGTVPRAKRQVTAKEPKAPVIVFGQDETETMRKRVAEDFPQIVGKELVLIYPSGGILPIRAWPLDSYCRLAEELLSAGYAVGVIGLEEDRPLAGRVLSSCQNESCIDLAGYTRSIRELMILFHFASLLITNDGGPVHFASMTPVPTITFFGPESPALYGSLDPEVVNYFLGMSCSPCLTAYNHRNSPCDGDNTCLKDIRPEEVLEKALEILRNEERNKPRTLAKSISSSSLD
jgi:ADP-heptose:LPS heptosyltransferase